MRNDQCLVTITSPRGSVQGFRRNKEGWWQLSSRNILRPCSAEQVLSHLLPALLPESKSRISLVVDAAGGTR